jgi:hypothetical protein
VQLTVCDTRGYADNQIDVPKPVLNQAKPVADYPLDPISRMRLGDGPFSDDESEPGGVHSILNCGNT